MTAILEGRGLAMRYGDLRVLQDVDFAVAEGEAVSIVGPNGAGKTTLLNVLAGAVRPAAGTVSFHGRDVTGTRPDQRSRLGVIGGNGARPGGTLRRSRMTIVSPV